MFILNVPLHVRTTAVRVPLGDRGWSGFETTTASTITVYLEALHLGQLGAWRRARCAALHLHRHPDRHPGADLPRRRRRGVKDEESSAPLAKAPVRRSSSSRSCCSCGMVIYPPFSPGITLRVPAAGGLPELPLRAAGGVDDRLLPSRSSGEQWRRPCVPQQPDRGERGARRSCSVLATLASAALAKLPVPGSRIISGGVPVRDADPEPGAHPAPLPAAVPHRSDRQLSEADPGVRRLQPAVAVFFLTVTFREIPDEVLDASTGRRLRASSARSSRSSRRWGASGIATLAILQFLADVERTAARPHPRARGHQAADPHWPVSGRGSRTTSRSSPPACCSVRSC